MDEKRPAEYRLRFVELDMLIGAMASVGVLDEQKSSTAKLVEGRISAADLTTPGTWSAWGSGNLRSRTVSLR